MYMAGRGRKVRKAKIAYDTNKARIKSEIKIQEAYITQYKNFSSGSPKFNRWGGNVSMAPHETIWRNGMANPRDIFHWMRPDEYRKRVTTGNSKSQTYKKTPEVYKEIANMLRPKAIKAQSSEIALQKQKLANIKPFTSSHIKGTGGNRMGAVYASNAKSGIGVSSAAGWGSATNTSGGAAGLAQANAYIDQGGWANTAYGGDKELQEKLKHATTAKQKNDLRAESEKRKQNEYLSLFGTNMVGRSAMGDFDAKSGKAKDGEGNYLRNTDVSSVSVFDIYSNVDAASKGYEMDYQGWSDLSGNEQVEFKMKLQEKLEKMDVLEKIDSNKKEASAIQSQIKAIENKIKVAEANESAKTGHLQNTVNSQFYNLSALEAISKSSKSNKHPGGSYDAYNNQNSYDAKKSNVYDGKWAGTGGGETASKYIRPDNTLSTSEKKIQSMYIEMNKLQKQKEQLTNTNTVFINAAAKVGTTSVVDARYRESKIDGSVRNILTLNDDSSKRVDENLMYHHAQAEDQGNAKMKVYSKLKMRLENLNSNRKNTTAWEKERDSVMSHVNSLVPDVIVHGDVVDSATGTMGTTGTNNISTSYAMRDSKKYGDVVSTKGVISQLDNIMFKQSKLNLVHSNARSDISLGMSSGMTNAQRVDRAEHVNAGLKSIKEIEIITGKKIKTGLTTFSATPTEVMLDLLTSEYVMLEPKIDKFGKEVPVYKLDKDGKKIKHGLRPLDKDWQEGDPTKVRAGYVNEPGHSLYRSDMPQGEFISTGGSKDQWMNQWVSDGGSGLRKNVTDSDLSLNSYMSPETVRKLNDQKSLLHSYGAWGDAERYIKTSLNQWTGEAKMYYHDSYKDQSFSEEQIIAKLWRGDTTIKGDNVVDDLKNEMFSQRAIRTEGAGRSSDLGKLYRGSVKKRDEWKNAMEVNKSQLIEKRAEESRLQKIHDAYVPKINQKVHDSINNKNLKQGQRLDVDKEFAMELAQSSQSLFDAHNDVKSIELQQKYYKLSLEKSNKSIADIKKQKKEADFETYQNRTDGGSTNRLQRGPLYGYYQAQGLRRRTAASGVNKQRKITRSGQSSLGGLVL